MAISKIDLKATTKYVSLHDDAIDLEKSDVEKYKEECDLKYLKFKENEHPTYLLLKNLPSNAYGTILNKYLKVDVMSGTMIQRDDRSFLDMSYEIFDTACKNMETSGAIEPVKAEQLSRTIVEEVSGVIWARADLSTKEKK